MTQLTFESIKPVNYSCETQCKQPSQPAAKLRR